MLSQEAQESVANQRQVGQEVGIATTRAVLPKEHIPSPVVSHFYPRPMPANQRQPFGRAVSLGKGAGKVVVRLGRALVGFLEATGVAQHNQATSKGQARLQGFDGEGMQAAGFDSSVAGFGGDKKGVSLSASNFWASLKRFF